MYEVIVMRRKKVKIVLLLILLIIFLYSENNLIYISKISIQSEKIPKSFQRYKIVHLSDFHNKSFLNYGKRVAEKVKALNPDIIVFTGDLIDSRRYKEEVSLNFMKELVKIAPVYYVNGNHEIRSGKFSSLEQGLKEIGVNILRNTNESISKNGEEIYIMGIDDPLYKPLNKTLQGAMKNLQHSSFKILLAHRPEYISEYSSYNLDLIFSGHAHGGQVRLPFIGGLVAPGQGVFPKYTNGKYEIDNTSMVVSRGLGNSLFPQRLFNRPQIIEVTLSAE